MSRLAEYVQQHAIRGACQCGRCIDGVQDPKSKQPTGHTADLVFFQVRADERATAEALRERVKEEAPSLLDGKERSYIEIGGLVGDQGLAMQLMGLGALLGLWTLLTPRSVFPAQMLTERVVMEMAGMGMVTIQSRGESQCPS